jgi:hypothetical protein
MSGFRCPDGVGLFFDSPSLWLVGEGRGVLALISQWCSGRMCKAEHEHGWFGRELLMLVLDRDLKLY